MKQFSSKTLNAILLSAGLILAMPALAQLPPQQTQGGITYVTGGVGLDESQAFQAARGQYNLHLTVTGRSGEFLADVPVKIVDSSKRTVLEVTTGGPYLFATLPPGRYLIIAGSTTVHTRNVQVSARGATNVHFAF